MTSDPLARLSAGLAEDERIARATGESASHLSPDWRVEMEDGTLGVVLDGCQARVVVDVGVAGPHIARQDPALTLRRVEAIRKVLRRHEEAERDSVLSDRDEGFEAGLYAALEMLADSYPEDTTETGELA